MADQEVSHHKWFQHRGRRYRVTFVRRPFREGLEARLTLEGREIKLAELGLGERALIAKLKGLLDQETSVPPEEG